MPTAWIVLHHLLETVLANLTRKILASLDLQRCMAKLESAVAHNSELTTQNNYKEHRTVFFIKIVNVIKNFTLTDLQEQNLQIFYSYNCGPFHIICALHIFNNSPIGFKDFHLDGLIQYLNQLITTPKQVPERNLEGQIILWSICNAMHVQFKREGKSSM